MTMINWWLAIGGALAFLIMWIVVGVIAGMIFGRAVRRMNRPYDHERGGA